VKTTDCEVSHYALFSINFSYVQILFSTFISEIFSIYVLLPSGWKASQKQRIKQAYMNSLNVLGYVFNAWILTFQRFGGCGHKGVGYIEYIIICRVDNASADLAACSNPNMCRILKFFRGYFMLVFALLTEDCIVDTCYNVWE